MKNKTNEFSIVAIDELCKELQFASWMEEKKTWKPILYADNLHKREKRLIF